MREIGRAAEADRQIEAALDAAGVDDAFFRSHRERFEAEAEEARRSGNRMGLARALVMASTNRIVAAEEADQPEMAEREL